MVTYLVFGVFFFWGGGGWSGELTTEAQKLNFMPNGNHIMGHCFEATFWATGLFWLGSSPL